MSIFTEGPTALIVDSRLDPDSILFEWAQHGFHAKTWAPKLTGADIGTPADVQHGIDRARVNGLHIGGWIQCGKDVAADVASVQSWLPELDLIYFCCELEYKANAGLDAQGYNKGEAYRAEALIAATAGITIPKALITYGRLDTAMHIAPYAAAGWHIAPEEYDSFAPADNTQLATFANTYYPTFLGAAIHPLVHTLTPFSYRGNRCGVYRPEGLL